MFFCRCLLFLCVFFFCVVYDCGLFFLVNFRCFFCVFFFLFLPCCYVKSNFFRRVVSHFFRGGDDGSWFHFICQTMNKFVCTQEIMKQKTKKKKKKILLLSVCCCSRPISSTGPLSLCGRRCHCRRCHFRRCLAFASFARRPRHPAVNSEVSSHFSSSC